MLDRSKCGALLALAVDAIKGMTNQDFLDALRGKHDGLLMVPALADADLALGPPMPALADADDDPRLDVMPLMGPALPEDVVEAPAMVAAAPPPVVPALPPIAALVGPAMAAFAPCCNWGVDNQVFGQSFFRHRSLVHTVQAPSQMLQVQADEFA